LWRLWAMSSRNPFEGTTVFKDAKTLDQGWTPDYSKENESLPCRDEEIQSLTALYRPVIMCGKNSHNKIFWSNVSRCSFP